jgi:hypothetical protein
LLDGPELVRIDLPEQALFVDAPQWDIHHFDLPSQNAALGWR